jgi:GNAT superfamily N-acetyltransferase
MPVDIDYCDLTIEILQSTYVRDVDALRIELYGTHSKRRSHPTQKLPAYGHPYVLGALDREKGKLVGIASLFVNNSVFEGPNGSVEDVVVLRTYQGHGIGQGLMKEVLKKALSLKVRELYLTSGAHRAAAHALYEKIGFVQYKTRNYRLEL